MSSEGKKLGSFDATMIIMGSMIGSGIFLAPSLIAGISVESSLGAGSVVLVWVVGGLLTLCGALSFGELASSFPRAGGQYVFLTEAFSPFWGFLYGWTLFSILQCGFIAAVAIAFANYLGVFFPWISQSKTLIGAGGVNLSSVQVVAILQVAALSWVNSRGLRAGATVQNTFTIAKVAALAGLVIFGLASTRGDWSNFQPVMPQAVTLGVLTGFAVALSKALFAYDSWYGVTFIAEQMRDPARTLPRSLFFGTLGVTIVYTLVNVTFFYILPVATAAGVPDQRIAAEVAQVLFGSAGIILIVVAILVSTAGCNNGLILAGPWLYYAMARDGLFFSGAAQLDARAGVPRRSLFYQTLWASALILSGSLGSRGAQLYSDLLTFTAFASLLFNALTITGLFVLRKKRPEMPRPYRVVAYPFVPLVFLLFSVFFLVLIAVGDPRNSGFGVLVMLAGAPLYFFLRRRGGPVAQVEVPAASTEG